MGAPKGNIFALGNNGGRPPIHDNEESILKAINEYFTYIQGEPDTDEKSALDWVRRPEAPTITGLALFLGYSTKQSIYDNIDKKEFSYLLKRAVMVIENHHEKRMDSTTVAGSIFVLKNMGWKDKTEVENTGSQTIVWKEEKTYEADKEANNSD